MEHLRIQNLNTGNLYKTKNSNQESQIGNFVFF